MIEIVPFRNEHLVELADFGNQEALLRPFVGELAAADYESKGPAYSARHQGRIVACAGLAEMSQYRAYVWAFLSGQEHARVFISIHRAVERFLSAHPYRRIDAQVAFDDAQGHRWMKMLGFQREVFCRPWFMPDGSSVSEYVRWGSG